MENDNGINNAFCFLINEMKDAFNVIDRNLKKMDDNELYVIQGLINDQAKSISKLNQAFKVTQHNLNASELETIQILFSMLELQNKFISIVLTLKKGDYDVNQINQQISEVHEKYISELKKFEEVITTLNEENLK